MTRKAPFISPRGQSRNRTLPVARRIGFLALLAFAAVMPNALQGEPPPGDAKPSLYAGFSGYERPVTTAVPEAQEWFDQGIQLLYGFNHDEAIRSFEQAAALDPSCAMAWWGAAYARGMHINKPEMEQEQSELAYAAAQAAAAALDEESEVEKALVQAVGTRYELPIPQDRADLNQRYAEAMEKVWHRFPDDADVGALFAESLMDLQPWDLWSGDGNPKGRVLEVLGVLERTLAHTPQHPGANHFYIHAIEASPWPEKGSEAAERLKAMIPGAGHLVHMPSHILIRTGQYAEASDANERAIKADEAYFAVAPQPDFYSLYFVHNIHFLAYAAMMEGRYETALAAARKIEQQIPAEFLKKNVKLADGFMPTVYYVMIRFGKWQDILAEPQPPEWRLFSLAEWRVARAIAHAALGETKQARNDLAHLDQVVAKLTDEWMMGNNPATDVIATARLMAEGELAYYEGDSERAFQLLRQAIEQEEQLRYDEPPGWMQPIRHALGALLMAEQRYAEAEAVYRADLVRHPNNAWSLLGLQQAFEKQSKMKQAGELAEQVEKAWARADVQPVASCYCHPGASPLRKTK